MNLEALRTELHDAVDEVIGRYAAADRSSQPNEMPAAGVGARFESQNGEWSYRWPSGDIEFFFESRWYRLDTPTGGRRVLVAWARRAAWRKDDRLRAIVFVQKGERNSTTFYPWTEFVETDDGRYAASVPDPRRPRKMLADGDPVPARFRGLTVERSDLVFHSIASGPSLRLVVDRGDEPAMVEHGCWVATLRGRF